MASTVKENAPASGSSIKDKVQLSPAIITKQGILRGIVEESPYLSGKFYSFMGIPYAQPPLNDLRFQSPKPPSFWQGIRDFISDRPGCYSRHPIFNTLTGSEDCLYLNVYTTEIPSTETDFKPKPVMVYIHGGSFTQGSGSRELYGPDFLIAEDVVLVTFNYRVGLLGFLSFDDPSLKIPGNAGLKDMVMALKWIQDNISNFGGDSQNVTLFGCSAGASSVHYLIASPLGKGLFHKAILQSGNLFCPWALSVGYTGYLKEMLKISEEKNILEMLKKLSVEQLLELQEKMKDTYGPYNQRIHGPVIENANSMEEAFLKEHPLEIINSGNYNHVPLIVGYSNREGLLYALYNRTSDGGIKQINNFVPMIPQWLGFSIDSIEAEKIGNNIKKFYYGDEEPSMDNVDNLFLILGDSFFLPGMYFTIRSHLRTSKQPIYFYRFSIDGRMNLYKRAVKLNNFYGACHADELGYLFKSKIIKEPIPNSKEDIGIRRLTKLWTNFAKYGNPNPVESTDLIPARWEQVTENDINYLEIGDNLTAGKNPDYSRMVFWDKLYSSSPKTQKYFIIETTQ